MMKLSAWLGSLIFEWLESTGRTVQLLLRTLRQLPRMNLRHVIYQMAHLGVDTMPIVFMMIVFTGMVMVWQATPALSRTMIIARFISSVGSSARGEWKPKQNPKSEARYSDFGFIF